jgi:hydrogenase-4 component F
VRILALVVGPALLGGVAMVWRRPRAQTSLLVAGAVLHAALTASLWLVRPPPLRAGLLAADDVGLLFLSILSTLFLPIAVYAVQYLLDGTHDEATAAHRFAPCLLWFVSTMSLVTLTRHLIVLWMAIEATTLASAPLVYFYERRPALEAAWKYLILCSVGLALALLGTFVLGFSAAAATHAMTLDGLVAHAADLSKPWLRAAFLFALVGYGTKTGLVPMHTWLPDAHSQAPSPVSALLSGALLNCAFLGVLRFLRVCVAAGEGGFARGLLVFFGLLSLGLGAAFTVGQRDYKRLFAYSSVENMGVVALGFGLGGVATFGALLHAVSHSLAKAGLFLLSGNVLRVYGTTRVADVRGIVRALPVTGIALVAGMLAVAGVAPATSFWSELTVFQGAVAGGRPVVAALFAAFVVLGFVGLCTVVLPMAQGDPSPTIPGRGEAAASLAPPIALVAAAVGLGLVLPRFLSAILHAAAGSFAP